MQEKAFKGQEEEDNQQWNQDWSKCCYSLCAIVGLFEQAEVGPNDVVCNNATADLPVLDVDVIEVSFASQLGLHDFKLIHCDFDISRIFENYNNNSLILVPKF